MTGAFAGVRVVDFSEGIAGPMATMHLADQDADVVKVEPPAGDRMKDRPGYLCWNRNKRCVTLDLGRFGDLRAARALIAAADVAVFDGRPGELERMGLDAITLRARHPGLVHAWLPPYGSDGRWSQLPPDDGLLSAVSGAALLQHSYGRTPVYFVTPLLGYGQATLSAAVLAAALLHRRRTGEGSSVRVSGLDAFAAMHPGTAIRSPAVSRAPSPSGLGPSARFRLYRCGDGEWLFFGALTAPLFLRALDVLDLAEVMAWEGIDGELANAMVPPMREKVVEALQGRFAEKPREHWMRVLKEADIPRGPVGLREEWFAGETVAANEMRTVLEHPALGPVEMPGLPLRFSQTPGSLRHLPLPASAGAVLADWRGPSSLAAAAPPTATSQAPGRLPLEGVRVLDLGAFIAAPFGGMLLATLGAEVVKVEPPSGDPFRGSPGPPAVNTDKRGLALDLSQPAARDAFRDLARRADVVLDNFRPGVRRRLELDYARLQPLSPRLVSCSLTAFGADERLVLEPGLDPIVQGRSGLMAAQGGRAEPVLHIIAINDVASGMTCVFGIAAALFARERTGRGQEVTTALVNQSIMFQSGELTSYRGRMPNVPGARDCPGVSALVRYYACADGWLLLSCPEQCFDQLCLALERPEWLAGIDAPVAGAEPRDGVLAGRLAAVFATMAREEALDRLLLRGVPAAPALAMEELFDDPFLLANGVFCDWHDTLLGDVRAAASFATWNGVACRSRRRAPDIGEHGREVLRDYGFDEARIGALAASGALVVKSEE